MVNTYTVTAADNNCRFAFDSVSIGADGHRRVIRKVVGFNLSDIRLTPHLEVKAYNLSLVDVLSDGKLSDSVRSNNGDLERVLATTAECIQHFFKSYPDGLVFFRGSDEVRTRLYRMHISKPENYSLINDLVELYGVSEEKGIFVYEPNMVCEAFLFRLR